MSQTEKGEPIYEYDEQGNKKIVGYKTKDDGTRRIEVSVDTEQIQELIREKQELKDELKAQKENVARKFGEQMLLKLQERCAKYNVEYFEPQDEGDITALISACQESEKSKGQESGRASLEGQIEGHKGKEFDSPLDMVNYLREKTKIGSEEEKKEAQTILDEIWKKTVKGFSEQPFKISVEMEKGTKMSDFINEYFRKRKLAEKEARAK